MQPKKTTMMKIKSLFYTGLLLLALVTVSCSSQCECTLYEYGIAIGSSTEVAQGQTCEEFSSFIDTPDGKMGTECVKKSSFQSDSN